MIMRAKPRGRFSSGDTELYLSKSEVGTLSVDIEKRVVQGCTDLNNQASPSPYVTLQRMLGV